MKYKKPTRYPRVAACAIPTFGMIAMLVSGTAQAAMVIYDGFDYDVGSLGGKGGSELGLSGTWTVNTTSVSSGSLGYGSLQTTGNSVGPTSANQNRFMGSRAVASGTLDGLLDDGDTLWFSVVAGYGAGGNRTNSRLAFSFGDSSFSSGNFDYDLSGGTGLGFTVGRFGSTNGKVVATQFTTETASSASGFANNIFDPTEATIPASYPGLSTNTDVLLIVGRVTWGATDTIDLFLPGTDLALPGTAHSSLSVVVDQSAFDTITMQRGDVIVMDEIRFGSDYASVVPVPEPSTALLGGLGMLALLRRRRA
jgi:hypothetical protein